MELREQELIQQAIPSLRRALWTFWALEMVGAALAFVGLVLDEVWVTIAAAAAVFVIAVGARLYFKIKRAQLARAAGLRS